MRIEMSTNLLPIIQPALYGTLLGSYYEECSDDCIELFKGSVVENGMRIINETLEDMSIKAEDGKLWSPQWYNYQNDQIHFDIVVDDNFLDVVKKETTEEFWNYVKNKREWKSYDGYICTLPTQKEKFYDNLEVGKYKMEQAVAMYINWLLEKEYSEKYFEEIQRDFEDDVIEDANMNGWYEYEEDM